MILVNPLAKYASGKFLKEHTFSGKIFEDPVIKKKISGISP